MFRHRVGRERTSNAILDHAAAAEIAIDCAAAGEDHSFHTSVTRGGEDVQRARDVDGIGFLRAFDGERDGTKRGVVQDVIRAVARPAAEARIANVAIDQREARPLRRRNDLLHLGEVSAVAAAEIVEADDSLIQLEQCLQQI